MFEVAETYCREHSKFGHVLFKVVSVNQDFVLGRVCWLKFGIFADVKLKRFKDFISDFVLVPVPVPVSGVEKTLLIRPFNPVNINF